MYGMDGSKAQGGVWGPVGRRGNTSVRFAHQWIVIRNSMGLKIRRREML